MCVSICVSHCILLASKKKDKQQKDYKREKQQGDEQQHKAVNVNVSVVVTLL